MDEFDSFNEFNNIEENNNLEEDKIVIRIDKRNARKCISYVEGWNLSLSELKEHLKTLKTKSGCNGSVKEKKNEDGSKSVVFQLSGDKRYVLENYLLEHGIKEENINIIG